MNTRTLTTDLIKNTTATIATNKSYFGSNSARGLANSYFFYGVKVSITTTKQRGWNLYESRIILATESWSNDSEKQLKQWWNDYRRSLTTDYNTSLLINSVDVENHSATKLQNAHDVAVLAGESFVLTILNKYLELLSADVDKEVITMQINELQSQLATLN